MFQIQYIVRTTKHVLDFQILEASKTWNLTNWCKESPPIMKCLKVSKHKGRKWKNRSENNYKQPGPII